MATLIIEDNFSKDFDFLSIVYDIIKSVEKDNNDANEKTKISSEGAHKVLELQKKIDHARELVKKLPGIELNKEEQLKQIDLLRKQLGLKRELLNKYRSLTFERDTQSN